MKTTLEEKLRYVKFHLDEEVPIFEIEKELIAKVPANNEIKMNDKISFAFNYTYIHAFDEISKKIIF